LGVEKSSFVKGEQFPCAPWRVQFQDLSQWDDGVEGGLRRSCGKPRNPLLLVIDRRVEKNRASPRGEQLKSRDVVQSESENGQPVAQAIVGDSAESGQLMDLRAESANRKFVVETLRDVIGRRLTENLGRALGHLIEGQTS